MAPDVSDPAAALFPDRDRAFAASFCQALFRQTTSLLSEQAEELIAGVERELEARAAVIDAGLDRLASLVGDVGAALPGRLTTLVEEYHAEAYDLFLHSRSAVAFYRLSGDFLRVVMARLVSRTAAGLLPSGGKQPQLALMVLGPGGRREYSPFCTLPLVLVHGEAEQPVAEALGRQLHEACAAIGLRPDRVVTPRNPEWRGTPEQWRSRLVRGLNRGDGRDTVQLLRLADQSALCDSASLAGDFRRLCLGLLRASRPALHNLVDRISNLESGTTLLGRARIERGGPYAGRFRLLEHALLPLSAGITALSLMMGAESDDTLHRIGELEEAGAIDRELAQQLREAWQQFSELRLLSEAMNQPQWDSREVFHPSLSPTAKDERKRLVTRLRAVAQLRRQVVSRYEQWEEQAPC